MVFGEKKEKKALTFLSRCDTIFTIEEVYENAMQSLYREICEGFFVAQIRVPILLKGEAFYE